MDIIEYLWQWVSRLIYLSLFAAFFELLLPNNSFRGLMRLVIGLLLLVVLLQPLQQLSAARAMLMDSEPSSVYDRLTARQPAQGSLLERAGFKKVYRERLEQQVRQSVLQMAAIDDCQVSVETADTLETAGFIKKMTVEVYKPLDKNISSRIQSGLAAEYKVDRKIINIELKESRQGE